MKLKTQNFKLKIIWNFKRGFTLIELLVVMTLMAIITSLVTVSYLSYERSERVKAASLFAKSQVRLAQNNAFSSKASSDDCGFGPLAGWYAEFNLNDDKIYRGTTCIFGGSENSMIGTARYAEQLPRDVKVVGIKHGSTNIAKVYTFYKPLKNEATFHSLMPSRDASGNLINLIGALPQDDLEITFGASSNLYKLVITPQGEVYEKE